MKTNFNEDNFNSNFDPSFEFSSDFEDNDNVPSLVDEFNITSDNLDKNNDTISSLTEFNNDYNDYINDDGLYNNQNNNSTYMENVEPVDDNLFNQVDNEEDNTSFATNLFGGIDETNEPFDIDLTNDKQDDILPDEHFDAFTDVSSDDIAGNSDLNVPISTDSMNENQIDETPDVQKIVPEVPSDEKKEAVFSNLDEKINKLDESTNFETTANENLTTDINNLFVKVNSNVQEASDIFLRNVEMKKILDNRFEELKKLQSDIEKSKKEDYDEINNYKEEVIQKLSAKKEEVEEKLNLLKQMQADFDRERDEFENYKREETLKIDSMKKEEEASFETRKNELNRIEDKLRKQKDFLEEERRQLSLDQIQYETDKNELANNMIKFNEIVSKFTNGIDQIN